MRREFMMVGMAEFRPGRHRLFVEDARRNGLYLRTTWHPEARTFVVSTWHDEVCTGAVRVPVEDAAELIGLLADGLAEAATVMPELPAARRRGRTAMIERIRAWMRRRRVAVEPEVHEPAVGTTWNRESA